MVYRAVAVSNNILLRAERDKVDVTPLKLQKVLYFVASSYGKHTGQNLFDERFEAWQFGPVIRSVHYEFRQFGGSPITSYATDAGQAMMAREENDPALRCVLDSVWPVVRNVSPSDLVRITHMDGSAWSLAWDKYRDYLEPAFVRTDVSYLEPLNL